MFVSEADLQDAGHGVSTCARAVYGDRHAQAVPGWLDDPAAVLLRVQAKTEWPPRGWWRCLADVLVGLRDLTRTAQAAPPLDLVLAATDLLDRLGPHRLALPPSDAPPLLDDGLGIGPPALSDAVARLAASLDASWTTRDDLAAQMEDLVDALCALAGPTLLAVCAVPARLAAPPSPSPWPRRRPSRLPPGVRPPPRRHPRRPGDAPRQDTRGPPAV